MSVGMVLSVREGVGSCCILCWLERETERDRDREGEEEEEGLVALP